MTTRNISVNAENITLFNTSNSDFINIKGDALEVENEVDFEGSVVFNGVNSFNNNNYFFDGTTSFTGPTKVSKLDFINSNGVDRAYLEYEDAHLELKTATDNAFTTTLKTGQLNTADIRILDSTVTTPKISLTYGETVVNDTTKFERLRVMENTKTTYAKIEADAVYAKKFVLKEVDADTGGFYFVRNGGSVELKNADGNTVFQFSTGTVVPVPVP
jgi:hypothetical protein